MLPGGDGRDTGEIKGGMTGGMKTVKLLYLKAF